MPCKVLYVPCLLESSQQTWGVVIGSIFQMRTLRPRELSDGQDHTVRSVILTHVGPAPGIFILRHSECLTVPELLPGGPSFAHEKACLPGRVCWRSSREFIHLTTITFRSWTKFWGWRTKSNRLCLCDIPRLVWERDKLSGEGGQGTVEPLPSHVESGKTSWRR